MAKIKPTAEQFARKERSEAQLKEQGIKFNKHWKYNQDINAYPLREAEAVVQRLLALSYLALKGQGLEQESLEAYNKRYDVFEYFTEEEADFINNPEAPEEENIDAIWKYESIYTLLWALGLVEFLDFPKENCDFEQILEIISSKNKEEWMQVTLGRTAEEIADLADLYYRYHLVCIKANEKQEDIPADLNVGIIYERHYSLQWLIRLENAKWDEVNIEFE